MTTMNTNTRVGNGTAVVKREARYVAPLADIYETRDAYVVELDLPGASKDSVRITVEDNTLAVQAEVPPAYIDGAVLIHREHDTDGFRRSFNLGDGIDQENIDASFEHGVLVLKLAKSERAKPRDISIR